MTERHSVSPSSVLGFIGFVLLLVGFLGTLVCLVHEQRTRKTTLSDYEQQLYFKDLMINRMAEELDKQTLATEGE